MLLRSYQGKTPRLGKPRFIAPNATIVGDVTLGDGSSVWYGAVIRSDLNPIRIGRDCNVRTTPPFTATAIAWPALGNGVTVGHKCLYTAPPLRTTCWWVCTPPCWIGAHIGSGSTFAAGGGGALRHGGAPQQPGGRCARQDPAAG